MEDDRTPHAASAVPSSYGRGLVDGPVRWAWGLRGLGAVCDVVEEDGGGGWWTVVNSGGW